jgi:hypothetical protein
LSRKSLIGSPVLFVLEPVELLESALVAGGAPGGGPGGGPGGIAPDNSKVSPSLFVKTLCALLAEAFVEVMSVLVLVLGSAFFKSICWYHQALVFTEDTFIFLPPLLLFSDRVQRAADSNPLPVICIEKNPLIFL